MPDPLRHVRVLAREIGPRSATGAAEAQAARYIAEAAGDYTHQVWLEPFRSHSSPLLPWMLLVCTGLAGGALLWVQPALGTVLTAVAAVLGGGQAAGWLELGRLMQCRPSQNVVSVVPAREALQQRLVIVAHYDSPSGWRPVHSFGLALMLAALGGLSVLAVSSDRAGWGLLALLATAVLVAGAALSFRVAQGPSMAADSAAGVAVALEAGKLLARHPLQHTEIWLVYTGCKEPGAAGLRHLLERYGPMLSDAAFVVLDHLGAGTLIYTRAEGLLQVRSSDPGLRDLLAGLGLNGVSVSDRETQAALLIDRGLRAVTLLSAAQGLAEPNLHAAVQVLVGLAGQLEGGSAENPPYEMQA